MIAPDVTQEIRLQTIRAYGFDLPLWQQRLFLAALFGDAQLFPAVFNGSIGSELASIAARYEPAQIILMERSENALFRQLVVHCPLEAHAVQRHLAERPDLLARSLAAAGAVFDMYPESEGAR